MYMAGEETRQKVKTKDEKYSMMGSIGDNNKYLSEKIMAIK